MNNISKTTFLKYVRCPRAAAFETQSSAIIRDYKTDLRSCDDETKTKLLKLEAQDKLRELFSDMLNSQKKDNDGDDGDDEIENRDFDKLLSDDQMLKTMMETYFAIEELSTKKAIKLYGGNIVAGQRINDQVIGQKIISYFDQGYNFYSFVDTFQEDDKAVRIIESKSTTSRKFIDLGPKIKGELQTLFEMSPQGVLHLKEDFATFKPFDKYYENREKLKKRVDDIGRYVYDLAWQRFIIEHSKSESDKREYRYFLSVLNGDYHYDGKKDELGNNIYNPQSIIIFVDLTTITQEMQIDLAKDFQTVIERINNPNRQRVNLDQSNCLIGKGYRECPWLSVCKKDYGVSDKNSVYVYLYGHNNFGPEGTKKVDKLTREELISRGQVNALDIDYEWLSDTQKVQYRAIKFHQPFIEKEFIAAMLNDLKYPLFHLDFETMNYPLPKFINEKPYQQSVFQYSLHYERKPGVSDKDKDNVFFLSEGKEDDREKLVLSLIKNIPVSEGGTVIVYNQSFEKGRLKELSEMFPQYRESLMAIRERVFDLMYFLKPNEDIRNELGTFKKDPGNISFYDVGLQRSYSIKKVLPIFAPDLNYGNLDEVHNGIEAQVAFLRLATLTGEAFSKTYSNMLEYCKQDTWAMVEVLRGLRKLISEK